MLSAAKHLLYLLENKQSRSFASLRMTPREGFFSNLLERSYHLPISPGAGLLLPAGRRLTLHFQPSQFDPLLKTCFCLLDEERE